jgi:hypothetical protein
MNTITSQNAYRAVIRSMIDHEDQLRAQRLGRLFTLNGFLFAALGFAWGRFDAWLVAIFAGVGMAAGVSAVGAIVISERAVKALADMVEGGTSPTEISHNEDLGQPNGLLPVLGSSRFDYPLRQFGRFVVLLYPSRLLPGTLIGAWLAIFIVRLVVSQP